MAREVMRLKTVKGGIKAEGTAQEVEHLHSKQEGPSSNPSTGKKKKKLFKKYKIE
jgi:hypothetical protein